jgi:hypothetical protein
MKYTSFLIYLAMLNFRTPTVCEVHNQRPRQPTNWDSTVNWKIYKLAAFKTVFRIPPDSLAYVKNRPLNDDSVHQYLTGVSKLPGNPNWMGCYLVSYELADHSTRKAIISQYGGFFYVQKEHNFYQIDAAQQKEWLEYLSAAYMAMPSK